MPVALHEGLEVLERSVLRELALHEVDVPRLALDGRHDEHVDRALVLRLLLVLRLRLGELDRLHVRHGSCVAKRIWADQGMVGKVPCEGAAKVRAQRGRMSGRVRSAECEGAKRCAPSHIDTTALWLAAGKRRAQSALTMEWARRDELGRTRRLKPVQNFCVTTFGGYKFQCVTSGHTLTHLSRTC